MRKDTKKIIITILIIVSMITIFFVFKTFIKKEELPEVKLQEKDKANKALAIMVSEDGEKYKEYKEEKLPGNEYKFKEAKCIDKNGNSIDGKVVEQEGKITINTNKTIYCTFYYDHKGITEILRENDTNKVISSNLVGDLYRYQGVGTKEAEDATHKLVNNNYICFGTSDKDACINNPKKYLYRIIGITTDEKLKLIKNTTVIENNIGSFSWNDKYYIKSGESYSCPNGVCPEWPNSLIFKRLNGISNGKVSGEGKVTDGGNTDIFVDNPNYDYLKSGDKINGGTTASIWYNLILDYDWHYGNITDAIASKNVNGQTFYGTLNNGITIWQIETGKLLSANTLGQDQYAVVQWKNTVNAKISLLYMHDYYLAYDNVNIWSYAGNKYNKNNWLRTVGWDGIMDTYRYYDAYYAYYIGPDGEVACGNPTYWERIRRPVFYVSNNILLSGEGIESSPYIIEQKA